MGSLTALIQDRIATNRTCRSWAVLIKCIFAAADTLLSTASPLRGGPRQDNLEGEMGDLLAQDMIRTLIEIWLRAGGQIDVDLWGVLKDRYPHWCMCRTEPIQQWSATCIGLTHRVLAEVNGGGGLRKVVIKYADGTSCVLDRWLEGFTPATALPEAWWRVLGGYPIGPRSVWRPLS